LRFLSIVGARPQFIKLAPLSRRLRAAGHDDRILHTGQHYSATMSERLFVDLELPEPDANLGIGSGSHGAQTGRMLEAIEASIIDMRPDAVIVFGDTNSTLAGALAAAKLGVPCAHVEAGLRSFNRSMPEELNRAVTDYLSDLLLVPTEAGMANLAREGLSERAHLVGDIMVDTLADNLPRAHARSGLLDDLGLEAKRYTLVTLHRHYNVDDPSYTPVILGKLSSLGEPVVFPVHPRTRAVMEAAGITPPPGVRMIDPCGYLDFIRLQLNAMRIVTDSGGVQKEAYLLGIPCVTVRPETEWVETVESGWNILADPRADGFVEMVRTFRPPAAHPPLFGAEVAARIVGLLERLVQSRA
jgi:UDP-GlcNAc3NAcA epimerase